MNLSIFVSLERWPEFDEQWKSRMAEEGSLKGVLDAIRLAGEKRRISRCVPLAKEHASLLEAGDRHADAARILGQTLVSGGNPAELSEDLLRLAEAAWSSEPWWESYRDMTGLVAGAPDLRKPWKMFAKALAFQKGTLVHHPGGWGTGEIKEVLPQSLELDVTFASGKKDRFPMTSAVDIFVPLRETDLRARYFRDPEGLKKEAKKEPIEALRAVLLANHGKATTTVMRNAMMSIGIEGSAWSAWWRKARKLAENSEEFEVAGTPQKSVITLLLEAKDPTVTLRRQLGQASKLAEVHARVRDLSVGGTVKADLLAVGQEILEQAAAQEDEPLQDRLAAWLFLRDSRKQDPEGMLDVLRDVQAAAPPPDPSTPSELWKLFQSLPTIKDQERAVETLPELFGESWMDEIKPDLQHAAPGMVRPLMDQFKKAGRTEDLLSTYGGLLARPLRAPSLMVALAGHFEKDKLEGNLPSPVQRAQALLNLAGHLHRSRRGNPHLTRVSSRLTDLLSKGKKGILRNLLADADTTALRSATVLCSRGVDAEVDHLVTEIALDHDRHFFAAQTGPFWEGDTIWTTRKGLESRSAELRELREVKIPANEEAIGRAASFGDLSENSEWEAAIEEQRNLTNRAMEIEEELRRAELIENAALPENKVCPGTRVRYRELDNQSVQEAAILGPWDPERVEGVQVISYRAPLAAGLLGSAVGETANIQLPTRSMDVEVLEIHALRPETVGQGTLESEDPAQQSASSGA